MTWPALLFWTVALAQALPLARGPNTEQAPLLGLGVLAALGGLGVWLAYLVVGGDPRGLAWAGFGVAAGGMLAMLLSLLRPAADAASGTDVGGVVQWFGTAVQATVFAVIAILCGFAGVGLQTGL